MSVGDKSPVEGSTTSDKANSLLIDAPTDTAAGGWLVHGSSMGRMNAIDQVGPMVNGVIFTVVAVLV